MAKLKTKEELIASYKKANKGRKEYLANAAGFDSPEEYLAHLEKKPSVMTGSAVPAPAPPPEPATDLPREEGEMLDMVIAFDTTGSMNSYIGEVRSRVKVMVNDLFAKTPNLRIKIVAFGDYCDMQSASEFGKAYQYTALTNDKQVLIDFIQTAKNTGGGDGDEFYELVIKKVVEETDWRSEAVKTFLLIGDCNPHQVGYTYKSNVVNNTIDWVEECYKAKEKGIKIDTLSIDDLAFYERVSEITGGLNIPFRSSKNLSQVLEGLTYVRTSEVNFTEAKAKAEATGDAELIGAYKSMTNIL